MTTDRTRARLAFSTGRVPKALFLHRMSDRPVRAPTPGFYAILDTGYVKDGEWEAKAEALLQGGAVLLQVRAKKSSAKEFLQLARRIHPLAIEAGVPLIINDHLEVALSIPGAGLHIGQDDLDPVEARKLLGPERILGLSTHSLEQAKAAIAQAGLLSYFAVGPVFATGTKPDYTPVGLGLVRQVAALRPPLPFFCIGGIEPDNAEQVLEAGGDGLVAVSNVLLATDTARAVRAFTEQIRARRDA